MKLTQLNRLQMPTWGWLNINAAQLETDTSFNVPHPGGFLTGAQAAVKTERSATPVSIPHLPSDMERLRAFVHQTQNYALTLTIPAGTRLKEPVFLDFILEQRAPVLVDYLHIIAEADSRADIVVRYKSVGDGAFFHGGFTLLEAGAESQVRLTKIQMLGGQDTHLDAAAVVVQEGAQGDTIFCELGGGQTIAGCNLSLAGVNSRGTIDTLYLGSGRKTQDFNYRMELRAPSTEGEITARGALGGTARKTLKSTLDFIQGASGAKGREAETVLTLSDRVVNLSAPLLLCGEADVEGSHATSSGKPDAAKLFYLMSRGFSPQDAKRLLVEASFTPILNKLPLPELRDEVSAQISEVVHSEN